MKIDIKKRYSFKYYDDLIKYMIDNGYELDYGDLWHIFDNMHSTKSRKYNKLGTAIIYLLDELKGEKRERLVYLLNTYFDFAYNSSIIKTYGHYQTHINYSYICNNKLVGQYLINLSKTLETKIDNENFEEFKKLF